MHCINNAQIDQLTLLDIIFWGQEMNSPSSELFSLICSAHNVRVTQMIKDEIAV